MKKIEKIIAKLKLKLPLTDREKAFFICFATNEQLKEFKTVLDGEK